MKGNFYFPFCLVCFFLPWGWIIFMISKADAEVEGLRSESPHRVDRGTWCKLTAVPWVPVYWSPGIIYAHTLRTLPFQESSWPSLGCHYTCAQLIGSLECVRICLCPITSMASLLTETETETARRKEREAETERGLQACLQPWPALWTWQGSCH